MIKAGSAKSDITPKTSVWMDGMIREHKSDGVHDPLYARALVLEDDECAVAVLSVDICALQCATVDAAKQAISSKTGISQDNIIIAATHTHSGPAALGYFNPIETQYVDDLVDVLADVAAQAAENMRPALLACASGREETISFYRRFRARDGRTVMIWEENPQDNDLEVLGVPDPEVGVLRIVDAADAGKTIAVLFNHAGHPNVMSGENCRISADYPGAAAGAVEEAFDAVALFVNGAQGTVDIDNWTYRDWDGLEHIGKTLADAVIDAAKDVAPADDVRLRCASLRYPVPARQISDEELAWAEEILAATGGAIASVADGVGDDYKALLFKKLHAAQGDDVQVEQVCFSIGDAAFITFPGELFTEIGMRIKAISPFAHTYILGLANGYVGYVPAKETVAQGGYEVDTRAICADAEDIIVTRSIELLTNAKSGGRNV